MGRRMKKVIPFPSSDHAYTYSLFFSAFRPRAREFEYGTEDAGWYDEQQMPVPYYAGPDQMGVAPPFETPNLEEDGLGDYHVLSWAAGPAVLQPNASLSWQPSGLPTSQTGQTIEDFGEALSAWNSGHSPC